jgi:selenocysteine lyase/cysteine desulfurase
MHERFDVAAVRREFPITKRMLYFDTAHQAPMASSIRAALERFYDESQENAGPKPKWLGRVEKVRSRVAGLLDCEPDEVAFIKNTSEGLNIAAHAIPLQRGDNVLLIHGDHPNNAYAWLNLRKLGVEVRFVELDSECADAGTFEAHVDERTRAISLSHVTFHAGHRHDLASISRLCERAGIYLVVDAMQSVGVFPADVRSLGISVLSAGCHKGLLIPQGLGILYCDRKRTELNPAYIALASLANPPSDLIARPEDMQLHGDARRFEIGNYNLADLHALDASLDLIFGIGVENISGHVLDLGDLLISSMDQLGVRIVGPRARQHRSHIHVLALPAAEWIEYLASRHVRASPERDGVRISFSMFNTAEEVERFATIVSAGLKVLGPPKTAEVWLGSSW